MGALWASRPGPALGGSGAPTPAGSEAAWSQLSPQAGRPSGRRGEGSCSLGAVPLTVGPCVCGTLSPPVGGSCGCQRVRFRGGLGVGQVTCPAEAPSPTCVLSPQGVVTPDCALISSVTVFSELGWLSSRLSKDLGLSGELQGRGRGAGTGRVGRRVGHAPPPGTALRVAGSAWGSGWATAVEVSGSQGWRAGCIPLFLRSLSQHDGSQGGRQCPAGPSPQPPSYRPGCRGGTHAQPRGSASTPRTWQTAASHTPDRWALSRGQ